MMIHIHTLSYTYTHAHTDTNISISTYIHTVSYTYTPCTYAYAPSSITSRSSPPVVSSEGCGSKPANCNGTITGATSQ